jgi:hypothetical protein
VASLAGDAQVEAIDGPNSVGALEGKSMPILTRLPNGKIGFRMMGKFAKSAAPAPIVKVTLENGESVRVGRDQIFFKAGMVETPASELKAGGPGGRSSGSLVLSRPPRSRRSRSSRSASR